MLKLFTLFFLLIKCFITYSQYFSPKDKQTNDINNAIVHIHIQNDDIYIHEQPYSQYFQKRIVSVTFVVPS